MAQNQTVSTKTQSTCGPHRQDARRPGMHDGQVDEPLLNDEHHRHAPSTTGDGRGPDSLLQYVVDRRSPSSPLKFSGPWQAHVCSAGFSRSWPP